MDGSWVLATARSEKSEKGGVEPYGRGLEIMKTDRQHHIYPRTSLRNLRPISVGKVLKPLSAEDDILQEMLSEPKPPPLTGVPREKDQS
jgi:hypothetical protein